MASKDASSLRRFVLQLPETDRKILVLFYAEGLTLDEIRFVLDLPYEEVMTRIVTLRRQARTALRKESSFAA